jgi:superoxide dismutase, Fe-Mn family
MINQVVYKPKSFNLSGLAGISDETLDMHFKLYAGYVNNTNELNEKIAEFLRDGRVDQDEMPAYSELKRRLGFEYNGMVLHEYYFANLKAKACAEPSRNSPFARLVERSFGDFHTWKADFTGAGKMRGVGWVVCYRDPSTDRISNHWISLHEMGNVAGYAPILVMDVWEHAFLLDYKPSEKRKSRNTSTRFFPILIGLPLIEGSALRPSPRRRLPDARGATRLHRSRPDHSVFHISHKVAGRRYPSLARQRRGGRDLKKISRSHLRGSGRVVRSTTD